MKFNEKIINIAQAIGEFYFNKSGDYDKAREDIVNLGIIAIEIADKCMKCGHNKTVKITTTKPGMLIGKRGENISALESWLYHACDIEKITIREAPSDIVGWMIPVPEPRYSEEEESKALDELYDSIYVDDPFYDFGDPIA